MLRAVNYLVVTTLMIILAVPSAGAISKRKSGLSLKHRTQLELRLGVREDTHDDDYEGLVWAYNNDDVVVSFGLNHWVDETTAFNLTVKALAGDYSERIGIPGVYSAEFGVVPLFVGFRKYLGQPGAWASIRPYLALGGGPVFGRERIEILAQDIYAETNTETAIGAYFGAGIDFMVSRHFMVGVNGGYNLLSDFDEPIGGHVNYSTAELGVGFGLVF